jgi:hypothetical protein
MKITLTRLLETSKILATDLGKQVPEFFNYLSEFVEQTIRSLRKGLTFQDNFDCEVKTVRLQHNTPQVIQSEKPATGIIPIRLVSQSHSLLSFSWYFDQQGRLTIKANFDPDPGQGIGLDIAIVILF